MADDSAQRAGQLKPSVDQMAEQFATSCGSSGNRREIRDLADDLVLDLIGTLGKASLGEIAQTVEELERRRKMRPPPGNRVTTSGAGRRRGDNRDRTRRASEAEANSGARDAFDITKPSELLDQVAFEMAQMRTVRDEDAPASGTHVRRPEPAERLLSAPRAQTEPSALIAEDKKNSPPKPPSIVLREGEQLVRSTGSGVVIRRIRTA